jgi:hypothetical protein
MMHIKFSLYISMLVAVTAYCFVSAGEPTSNDAQSQSKVLFFGQNYSQEDLFKEFKGREGRVQYFLDEITNYVDRSPQLFFDYVNPETSNEQFMQGSVNIYKKILWMKNIEKSPKERRAIHDLDRFVATNYNTERLPARAYSDGQPTPKPLTVSQLVDLAFNAIPNDNVSALRALVENYNLVNAKDKLGNSLLAHAVMLKKSDIVMLLIHNGADINAANIYGTTPLILAVQSGNVEQVRTLLKYGSSVKQLDNTKRSALDYASGNVQIRALLAAAGSP